jgi:hypothetical protein
MTINVKQRNLIAANIRRQFQQFSIPGYFDKRESQPRYYVQGINNLITNTTLKF